MNYKRFHSFNGQTKLNAKGNEKIQRIYVCIHIYIYCMYIYRMKSFSKSVFYASIGSFYKVELIFNCKIPHIYNGGHIIKESRSMVSYLFIILYMIS